MEQKIVLVDDERDILEFLGYNLKKAGYQVYTAKDGETGLELIKHVNPDLVLLDLMMPKIDGMEVCRQIREHNMLKQPVITFLTSRAEDYIQIAGLKAGADDYIAKPIRPRLLLAKIEVLLKRTNQAFTKDVSQQQSSFYLDHDSYLLVNKNKKQVLPKKEFELLHFLMQKPGKVFSRDQIMYQVWGTDTVVGERTIDVHIRRLRKKIGEKKIRTIKGVGYTLAS